MDKVVSIAVGSYEGGLLVYKVDLENDIHLRSFATKDSMVCVWLNRGHSRAYCTMGKHCTQVGEMNP